MPEPVYLLYLDSYHLDDPLYVSSLARMMRRLEERRPPCLILHGSGDRAERLLEAEGLFPERGDGGIRVRTAQEAAQVEKALRQVNRRIVAALTDEVVPAVGLHGVDRGLIRTGADGRLAAGKTGWLRALALRRVIPVLSTLVAHAKPGLLCEASMAEATLALARALEAEGVVVVFFTRNDQPGLLDGETPRPEVGSEALPETVPADSGAVRQTAAAGFSVLLTSPAGLFGGDTPQGTKIFAGKSA